MFLKFTKIFSALFSVLSLSGCLSYTWRVSSTGPDMASMKIEDFKKKCVAINGIYDENTVTCRSVLLTTAVGTGDKVACYITGIVYGGWCWFISPGAGDREEALFQARELLGEQSRVEYLGRR